MNADELDRKILGNRIIFYPAALEAMRSAAWRSACDAMDMGLQHSIAWNLEIVRSAENALNDWPNRFFETAMI